MVPWEATARTKLPSTRYDLRIVCLTQSRSILGNYVKYRLNVRRRAGNDTQDFARGSLLLQ